MSSHAARGNSPKVYVDLPERAKNRTAKAEPAEQTAFRQYSPRQAERSEKAISSNVPPRWTVAARLHSAAVQGTGPESAQSILKAPMP